MRQRIEAWLDLPWTIEGPEECTVGCEVHYVVRVRELPDFQVVGTSAFEALHQVRPSLRSYFRKRLAVRRRQRRPAA